jgi:hypothetical protein
MGGIKCGRCGIWRFLLVATACLASGTAFATCNPAGAPGNVPCYIRVQPIDVANVQTGLGGATVVYSPFNTTPSTVDPTSAGLAFQAPTTSPPSPIPSPPPTPAPTANPLASISAGIPNNSASLNPIGFVVEPNTGLSPGQPGYPPMVNDAVAPGVDVTRTLLQQLGIDLVWLPMTEYVYNSNNPSVSACPAPTTTSSCVPAPQDFTNLNVQLASTGSSVATCSGFISGTTLTITSACTVPNGGTPPKPAYLAAYNFLTGLGISNNADGSPATYITGLGTGSGGAGSTYKVTCQPACGASGSQIAGSSKKPITITAFSSTLTSSLFKTLSQQDTSPTAPKAISQNGLPLAPLGGAALVPAFSPADPSIVNMFFVNTLTPPAAIGGTLYGFAWLCNNGVAISSQTFAQGRPDTIAHELLHNLCLDHGTYGAGPWTQPTGTGSSYVAPFGVVPQIPGTPLPGQCDSNYPECGANLMTTGILRTEPTLGCILAGYPNTVTGQPDPVPAACKDASGNQLLGFFNTNPALQTDRLNFASSATSAQLPVSQQGQAVKAADPAHGPSGLLFTNNPTLQFSGLLSPIPQETTKAQLETGGSSADRAIFDLSGPADGKPGETLLAWILTLPQEQTFAKHDGFHILSQSRQDLVQDVKYYPGPGPGPGKDPLKRNIAYRAGDDDNADDASIATADRGPCAFATTECLVIKFQSPGFDANDSISFSNSILSGDVPITKEDLCKAKITYIFSDGFVTTSDFGVCPPVSLPLIANSWHPDPHVAPHFHAVRSNLLLADPGSPACTPDPTTGLCPSVDQTSISDADVFQDAGAPQQSCDNGATMRGGVNNPVTGLISGPNIIIQGGQTCHYQDCEFKGSLTINNATAYLKNCQVDGQLTMNSGKLNLLPLAPNSPAQSVSVLGNIQIGSKDNLPNSFSIGPGTTGHNLTVQNLPSGGLGYVCNSTFVGGVSVNNNASSIQIGEPTTQNNCAGNFISGGLSCKGNTATLIGGQNNIQPSGGASGQCTGF